MVELKVDCKLTSRLGCRLALGHSFTLIATVDHLGMEACFPIGVVLHGAHIAIGLDQRVLALDHIAVALLALVLVVASVRIIHSILEGITRMCILQMSALINNRSIQIHEVAYKVLEMLLRQHLEQRRLRHGRTLQVGSGCQWCMGGQGRNAGSIAIEASAVGTNAVAKPIVGQRSGCAQMRQSAASCMGQRSMVAKCGRNSCMTQRNGTIVTAATEAAVSASSAQGKFTCESQNWGLFSFTLLLLPFHSPALIP